MRISQTFSVSKYNDLSPQPNPDSMYENISAPSAEQDDHHYMRLHFSQNHTEDLYSTIHYAASNWTKVCCHFILQLEPDQYIGRYYPIIDTSGIY